MQNALDRLNGLTENMAHSELLACCGSSRWAREMVARRPFHDSAELLTAGDQIWRSLNSEDWREAFASHPQIGEQEAEKRIESEAGRELSNRWSAQEQSGTEQHDAEVMARLAEGNLSYRRRFGYIFIVCATGKTAPELLAILEQRLQNNASAELPIAAEEQRLILQLRLEKLLAAQPA
jgi:2-oxo-4-hydroxy-4-carboxy-5-ureidoimidazoline decarboxylase